MKCNVNHNSSIYFEYNLNQVMGFYLFHNGINASIRISNNLHCYTKTI